MAVRCHMLLKNSQVERILVELPNIFLSLETHENSMGIVFDIFIRDTSYRS